MLGVTGVTGKMRENRPRWYGRLERRRNDEMIEFLEVIGVEKSRGKGRPKKTRVEIIRRGTYIGNVELTRKR